MSIEIRISEVGREGQGVGFDEDRNVYFVRGAIPGDRVRVEPVGERRYRDAELIEVTSASAQRIEPCCKHFLDCGGCDWLQWDYPSQLEAKQKGVLHTLERSQLSPMMVHPIIGAEKNLFYRTRVQVRKDGKKVGFFRRDSHDIIDIENCSLACPEINHEIQRLRSEPASSQTQKFELYLDRQGKVHRKLNSPHASQGFQQIHAEQNAKLQAYVKDLVALSKEPATILELFAGNGNLTEAYVRPGDKVVAVDSHPGSCDEGNRLLQDKDVEFRSHWVGPELPYQLPKEFFDSYDTLVLDPPRSGVGSNTLQKIVGPRVRRIIYVSCAALTFSQDVKVLSEKGFVFRSLQTIDMFPQTRHVELVGYFLRSSFPS